MAYGIPSYARDGVAETAFNQKQSISFYLLRSDLRAAFDQRLQGYHTGRECLCFRRPETIDYNLVRDLVHATAAPSGMLCCELTCPRRELPAHGRDQGLRDISQALQEHPVDGLSAIQVVRRLFRKRSSLRSRRGEYTIDVLGWGLLSKDTEQCTNNALS